MANQPVTVTWVTNELGLRFMNSVKGIANFNRSYDDSYRVGGAKVGNTVQARIPTAPTVRRGSGWAPQGIVDRVKPITLSYQTGVDFAWSSVQATTEIDRIKDRYINPAADVLASDADALGLQDVYRAVWNAVGTPGTTPSATLTYLQAVVKILDGANDGSDLKAVLDTMAAATIANTASTLFNPREYISESTKRGRFDDKILGISEWFQDQNVPRHTTGAFTSSTPLVNGASQTGSSLVTDGWASGASTLRFGDVFTIANVFGVNPLSRVSTGRLQQFSVQADVSDSTGAMTISISPAIITSGVLQTVSAAPADNAAINVWSGTGTYAQAATASPQSFVFHRDFAAFVMADLVEPDGGAKADFIRSRDFGISIRLLRQYQMGSDENGSRLDMLFGAAPLQERLACRVVG